MAPLLQIENLKVKYRNVTASSPPSATSASRSIRGRSSGSWENPAAARARSAATVMRLLPPNGEIAGGRMLFQGQDLCALEEEPMRKLRGKRSLDDLPGPHDQPQSILQCRNPDDGRAASASRRRVRPNCTGWPSKCSTGSASPIPKSASRATCTSVLRRHCASGSWSPSRLMSHPALLVADEPTSALDVTLEAQIVDLIRDLRDEPGTAVLYITHDLGVVAQLSDRVIVMYAGNIIEAGDVFSTFAHPQRPCTRAPPVSSLRAAHRAVLALVTIPGRVPSLRDLPSGCKFAPRRHRAEEICRTTEPPMVQLATQTVLCHSCRGELDCNSNPRSKPPRLRSPRPLRAGQDGRCCARS